MEASYLPLELTSIEALNSSLKKLDESMPKVNNKVHLHHGPNSIAIRGNNKAVSNGINGVIKPDKTLVDLVREEWKPFKEPYPAHPLLRSGHLQTLYTGYSDSNDEYRVFYARKLLGMYDGGTVGLDFVLESEAQYKRGIEVDDAIRQRKDYVENLPPRIRYMRGDEEPELLSSDDDRPMLITLHGLSGGSHELYLRAMLYHITKAPSRWAACSLNARGCGRTSITTRQLFCANWTGVSSEVRVNFQRIFERQ
jgi:predicted alpha/beta-fold hydrolase